MYLNSLSKSAISDFSNWLLASIGHGIKLERSAGHVQILLQDLESDEFFNVADMGYGFSQILPILAQIWSSLDERTRSRGSPIVAIEQPELHLHPAYQAKLADLMAKVVQNASVAGDATSTSDDRPRRPLKLIIETHSETMIARLGELVAAKQIDPNLIAIYIFTKDETNNETSVKQTHFLEDGTLQEWPIGFFAPSAL
jgi:predicted ATPase